MGACSQCASTQCRALPHATQTVTLGPRDNEPAVVTNAYVNKRPIEGERDLGVGRPLRVFQDIGQRLLHDSEDRQLQSWRNIEGCAHLTELDVQSRGTHALDEPGQAGQLWLRFPLRDEIVGAEHAEQLPHIGQRQASRG